MKGRCIIITAYIEGELLSLLKAINYNEEDYIICADKGYELAEEASVFPHLVLGDWDSAQAPSRTRLDSYKESPEYWAYRLNLTKSKDAALPKTTTLLHYSPDKDDTDTMLALKFAIGENISAGILEESRESLKIARPYDGFKGFDNICILGGVGGRADHTVGNLATMAFALTHTKNPDLKQISMMDDKNHIMLIKDTSITIVGAPGELISLASYSDTCKGVSITGAKWPLENATLTNTTALGISNRFVEKSCTISVESGLLLVMGSVD